MVQRIPRLHHSPMMKSLCLRLLSWLAPLKVFKCCLCSHYRAPTLVYTDNGLSSCDSSPTGVAAIPFLQGRAGAPSGHEAAFASQPAFHAPSREHAGAGWSRGALRAHSREPLRAPSRAHSREPLEPLGREGSPEEPASRRRPRSSTNATALPPHPRET